MTQQRSNEFKKTPPKCNCFYLLDHIAVEQRYWWEGGEQRAAFIERGRDGKVVQAHARNYEKDGRLYCEVKQDNGQQSLPLGHFKEALCFGIAGWMKVISSKASRSESFRRLPEESITSMVSAFTAAAHTLPIAV